jgi:hypothetical protein
MKGVNERRSADKERKSIDIWGNSTAKELFA